MIKLPLVAKRVTTADYKVTELHESITVLKANNTSRAQPPNYYARRYALDSGCAVTIIVRKQNVIAQK